MKAVGSGLGYIINDRSSVPPILGAVVGEDLNFSDGILISEEDQRPTDGCVVIGLAINLEIVCTATLPIRREVRTIVISEGIVTAGGNAWGQERNDIKAISYGKISGLSGFECLTDLKGIGLDQRRDATFDRDFCRSVTDLKSL